MKIFIARSVMAKRRFYRGKPRVPETSLAMLPYTVRLRFRISASSMPPPISIAYSGGSGTAITGMITVARLPRPSASTEK